ncbi:MAG: hypothetical protein FWC73_08330 [Defluviitaleaceae bacterium]|nr:hypothetical protein [Defluviitaleaceae bacterium]
MYNFSFHVTADDYLEFNKHHNWAIFKTRKFNYIIVTTILILIGFLLFDILFLAEEFRIENLGFISILTLMILINFMPSIYMWE